MVQEIWRGETREEYEKKLEWRATLSKGGKLFFIMAGQGDFSDRYYKYSIGQTLPDEVVINDLRTQQSNGTIELVKGSMPAT
jgi:hypothetical protein